MYIGGFNKHFQSQCFLLSVSPMQPIRFLEITTSIPPDSSEWIEPTQNSSSLSHVQFALFLGCLPSPYMLHYVPEEGIRAITNSCISIPLRSHPLPGLVEFASSMSPESVHSSFWSLPPAVTWIADLWQPLRTSCNLKHFPARLLVSINIWLKTNKWLPNALGINSKILNMPLRSSAGLSPVLFWATTIH